MHREAEQQKVVAPGTSYAEQTDSLSFVLVKMAHEGDTLTRTFYLNASGEGVVGVK